MSTKEDKITHNIGQFMMKILKSIMGTNIIILLRLAESFWAAAEARFICTDGSTEESV